MYKWFLAWRYLNTKLIAFFGIASVMLCVAMVLVVLSVMGGFLDTIKARSRGLHSEILLEGRTYQGFPMYAEFQKYLSAKHADLVRVSTPVIQNFGLFRIPSTEYTRPARVLGIRFEEYVRVNDFKKGLQYEKYFPGTTKLGPQMMPVAGAGEDGKLQLPEPLASANATWRASEPGEKALADFDKAPFEKSLYPRLEAEIPGERVFAAQFGPPEWVGAEKDGVIVGADLLHYRRPDGNFDRVLVRGADVALALLPLTRSGNVTNEPPSTLPLRYVDDSRTGIYEIDSMCVYVDFAVLQKRLAMDAQPLAEGGFTSPRISQLLVALQPGTNLEHAKEVIATAWTEFLLTDAPAMSQSDVRLVSGVDVYTWEDMQRQFIQAVEKEKVLVTFLFGMISMVAIVLVGCIFYMIVEKKTKDIGILKALGASGRGVGSLFVVYALAVGVIGSLLGLGVGSVFVWKINAIQDFLASLNPQLRVWSPEVYSFDRIPEVVKTADAIGVAVVAVLSSVLGSLLPAWIAARVWPVKALRYE